MMMISLFLIAVLGSQDASAEILSVNFPESRCENPILLDALEPGDTRLSDATDLVDNSEGEYRLVGVQYFAKFGGQVISATSRLQEGRELINCHSVTAKEAVTEQTELPESIRAKDGFISGMRRYNWALNGQGQAEIFSRVYSMRGTLLPFWQMTGPGMLVRGTAVRKANGTFELRVLKSMMDEHGNLVPEAWVVGSYQKF